MSARNAERGYYHYIGRRYGIQPTPGERVQETDTGRTATVCRPHPRAQHYVRVRFDDFPRHIYSEHPRSLIYLDRPPVASMYDPETGYAVKEAQP